ncbi:MAG: GNAT family N-acetyltransferase [Tannerella sp.]|nr:GNAT family N-acetyltransferase [Tannerella sp.]
MVYKKLEEKEIAEAGKLLLEYVGWMDRDLSFQNIDEELDSFPKIYSEPDGCFIVAVEGEAVVGCVGLKKLDGRTCEMKRLYVDDRHKGKGVGKKLAEKIIEEARAMNYERMRLDTLYSMTAALAIYRRNGFYEIEPYYHNPYSGVIYLEKKLQEGQAG